MGYLTGFTGDDSYLIVSRDGDTMMSDKRYTTQLEEECPDLNLNIRGPGQKMIPCLERLFKKTEAKRIAFESSSMTVAMHKTLSEALKYCDLVPCPGWVENLRMTKDRDEIERTRRA